MGYFNYLQKKESGETLPKNTFYGAQPPRPSTRKKFGAANTDRTLPKSAKKRQ